MTTKRKHNLVAQKGKLVTRIERQTEDCVFQKSKSRSIFVVLEPPNKIGLRLQGCTKVFWLTAGGLFWAYIKRDANDRLVQKQNNKHNHSQPIRRGRT